VIVLQVQAAHAQPASQPIGYQQGHAPPPYSTAPVHVYAGSVLYPSLTEYMGLEITPEMVSQHAVVPASSRQVCCLFLLHLAFFECSLTQSYTQCVTSVHFSHFDSLCTFMFKSCLCAID